MNIRRGLNNDIDSLLKNRIEFLNLVSNHDKVFSEEFLAISYNLIKQGIETESIVVFLAEEAGKIVSVAMVCYYNLIPSLKNLTGKTGYIQNVYTVLEYRGRGLASELMNRIREDAKSRGVGRLILNATDMGRPIYEKLGYKMAINEMICELD